MHTYEIYRVFVNALPIHLKLFPVPENEMVPSNPPHARGVLQQKMSETIVEMAGYGHINAPPVSDSEPESPETWDSTGTIPHVNPSYGYHNTRIPISCRSLIWFSNCLVIASFL